MTLRKTLDYDDPAQSKMFKLYGVAVEGSRETRVPVEIRIVDVNDNLPRFTQPLYTATIREDVRIGQFVTKGKFGISL